MMKLDEWIRRSEMRRATVARLLGISRGHLGDLCSGRAWPGRAMAWRIRSLTHGEVTPNDFLEDELTEALGRAGRAKRERDAS
jgi:DNA-binding transcriptional regulator YdaS (Cro superfamily)